MKKAELPFPHNCYMNGAQFCGTPCMLLLFSSCYCPIFKKDIVIVTTESLNPYAYTPVTDLNAKIKWP